jgi:hypothetical protein
MRITTDWRASILPAMLFLCILFSGVAAQEIHTHPCSITLPVVAMIDIEPDNAPISLVFAPPLKAGLPLDVSSVVNSTKWLNYTSSNSAGSTRRITAQLVSGAMQPGLALTLTASSYSGTGAGTLGVPSGTISLSSVAQTLISGISSCYTGNGAFNGHQLSYNLSIRDYSSMVVVTNAAVIVAFTLMDN